MYVRACTSPHYDQPQLFCSEPHSFYRVLHALHENTQTGAYIHMCTPTHPPAAPRIDQTQELMSPRHQLYQGGTINSDLRPLTTRILSIHPSTHTIQRGSISTSSPRLLSLSPEFLFRPVLKFSRVRHSVFTMWLKWGREGGVYVIYHIITNLTPGSLSWEYKCSSCAEGRDVLGSCGNGRT